MENASEVLSEKIQRLRALLASTTDDRAARVIRDMIAEAQAALDKINHPDIDHSVAGAATGQLQNHRNLKESPP